MTSKERAALRAQANTIDTTLMVGKGGVVIAVSNTLKIPVIFVGVGEQMDDLMAFDAHSFVEALI